ncbi:MAG: hypothetical protein WD844_05085 [Thermoleophilaceae bacterium]
MDRTRPLKALILALALGAGMLAGCGAEDEGTAGERAAASSDADEAHREGLAFPLGGLEYNVYITRQLNLRLPEDKAYYNGPDAPAGSAYYGVFLEVCNREQDGEPRRSAERFTIHDTQGNEFEPVELEETNPFAYQPGVVEPGQCVPAKGSIPQLGPTGGALLMFELPQEATENRPLELEISGGFDVLESERETLAFELDI